MHQKQNQQKKIQTTIRRLIRQFKAQDVDNERRKHARSPFVRSVRILTEDHRELHVLTRDMSPTGVGLVGTRSLLGQKVRLWLPQSEDDPNSPVFLVQILWSNIIGDGLFENGGVFLELLENEAHHFKVVADK